MYILRLKEAGDKSLEARGVFKSKLESRTQDGACGGLETGAPQIRGELATSIRVERNQIPDT